MSKVGRKLLTCIKKGCDLCPRGTSIVPETCEYKILHVLEKDSAGFHQRGRRSGKTRDAMFYAEKCRKAGYDVAYVALCFGSNDSIYLEGLGVKVLHLSLASSRLQGFPPMYVITDEVKPSDVSIQTRGDIGMIFERHYHLIGFYT